MARRVECPICEQETLELWEEPREFWGSICYEPMQECVNPNCGEEIEEDEDEEE